MDAWYFAYGSNLDPNQKTYRTGEIRQSRVVELADYRFVFNKRVSNGFACANIEPSHGARVLGVAFLCSPDSLASMDKWEGVPGGHYARAEVKVRAEDGSFLEAIAYVAERDKVENGRRPSADYLARIVNGARHWKLPEEYIKEIEAAAKGTH